MQPVPPVLGTMSALAPSPPPSLFAPVLLRFAPDCGGCRVLDLDPLRGAAGDVARAHPLADDALAAELAGVLEYFHPVAVQMLAQVQAGAGIAHELRQLVLAPLDRHRA